MELDSFRDFWPILDHVLHAHSQTRIPDICMDSWQTLSTWVDLERKNEEATAVAQRLTWYAVLLGKEGIHFRDTEGTMVIDYFSR